MRAQRDVSIINHLNLTRILQRAEEIGMGAFFDRLTAFGQPLTIVAVLMRIGVAVVIGAVIGIER